MRSPLHDAQPPPDTVSGDGPDQAPALAARAAGRHAVAAELWRDALRERPEDWRAALELKQDMAASGRYAESDPLFRRAARHLPDAEWLAHYRALYAFHGPELDALAGRAREMLARRPVDPGPYAVLGDVARQRRDWPAAEAAFAAALALDPASAEFAAKLREVRLRQRVARTLADKPPEGDEYAVALINLDRNAERLAEMRRQLAGCTAPLHRISGVEGGLLPRAAVLRLAGDADSGRGTLGCFLSHAAAWELMLDRGLAHCLVIEDDVVPLLDWPPRLGPLGLPPGYDLCFVNDRLEPRLPPDMVERADDLRTLTLAEAMATFPPEDNAPGADGYLVSAAGARKLLAWVAEDGFGGDVDWRLLAYGLTPGEIEALPPGHARGVLDALGRRVGRADRLCAHVLHPALTRTVPVSSDREDGNRALTGDMEHGETMMGEHGHG